MNFGKCHASGIQILPGTQGPGTILGSKIVYVYVFVTHVYVSVSVYVSMSMCLFLCSSMSMSSLCKCLGLCVCICLWMWHSPSLVGRAASSCFSACTDSLQALRAREDTSAAFSKSSRSWRSCSWLICDWIYHLRIIVMNHKSCEIKSGILAQG